MVKEGKYCFGTVMEVAREIWEDLSNGNCSRWDLGGYGYTVYENDDEVLKDLNDGFTVMEIVNSFEGWGGLKVLEDYPFDGDDLILIGDQYGGGCFCSYVIPEGIKGCEGYGISDDFIKGIAETICGILDLSFDGYILLEKDGNGN